MTDRCYAAIDAPTLLERLWRRLFPARYREIPEDLEGFAPSYMITEVRIHLGWVDRLRILVSGNLRVETTTKTDVIITKMASQSTVTVLAPGSLHERH